MSMKYKRHTVATLIDILSRFDDDMPIWIYTKEGAHPLFKVVDGSPEDHIAILVDYEKKNFEFKTTHSENDVEIENVYLQRY